MPTLSFKTSIKSLPTSLEYFTCFQYKLFLKRAEIKCNFLDICVVNSLAISVIITPHCHRF